MYCVSIFFKKLIGIPTKILFFFSQTNIYYVDNGIYGDAVVLFYLLINICLTFIAIAVLKELHSISYVCVPLK